MRLRRLEAGDAPIATQLVRRGYDTFVAPGWESESALEFARTQLSLEAMSRLINEGAYSAGAFDDHGALLGVLIMPRPTWLALLFVDPACFRRGIAMELWSGAREYVRTLEPPIEAVTLNSSAFAVGFYRKAGFVELERVEKAPGRPTFKMVWKVNT